MSFVFRMVGRELRASWRRLVFFFVCVAIGVGAIVALRSVIQRVGLALLVFQQTDDGSAPGIYDAQATAGLQSAA